MLAPVRPTFTSIRSSLVCCCCAANLNAVAQRGNLAVLPRRSRSARSASLIDDAVGVELELLALGVPRAAERDDVVDAVAHRRHAVRPAGPSRASPTAARSARAGASFGGSDVLVDEGLEPAPRHQGGSRFRIVPAATLRGFAYSGSPASARSWLIRSKDARGRNTSPRTSNRDAGPPRSVSGIDLIVRTFARDVLAAEAVAPRRAADQAPVLVGQRDAQAVNLQLRDVRDRRVAEPAALAQPLVERPQVRLRRRRCPG